MEWVLAMSDSLYLGSATGLEVLVSGVEEEHFSPEVPRADSSLRLACFGVSGSSPYVIDAHLIKFRASISNDSGGTTETNPSPSPVHWWLGIDVNHRPAQRSLCLFEGSSLSLLSFVGYPTLKVLPKSQPSYLYRFWSGECERPCVKESRRIGQFCPPLRDPKSGKRRSRPIGQTRNRTQRLRIVDSQSDLKEAPLPLAWNGKESWSRHVHYLRKFVALDPQLHLCEVTKYPKYNKALTFVKVPIGFTHNISRCLLTVRTP